MNALPKRFEGIFAWLTLYVIPMAILIPLMAVFLVDHATSNQGNMFVRHLFGEAPIFATYPQALLSLCAIPVFGLVGFLFAILLEMIVSLFSRISVGFHLLSAWIIGFLSLFGLLYLRWIRLLQFSRSPLSVEFERAFVFGLVYAAISYIALRLLRKIRFKENQPISSIDPSPATESKQ